MKIKFKEIKDEPIKKIYDYYIEAINAGQDSVEAISVSSYNADLQEVNSRFVNLKQVIDNKFIFFSNYESIKGHELMKHPQAALNIYWNKINLQIRMKGYISFTDAKFNQEYFSKRSLEKNALAISSKQSKVISSYEDVKKNYEIVYKTYNLSKCPDYWGGYSFVPYCIELWKGHRSRLNHRNMYHYEDGVWLSSILEP